MTRWLSIFTLVPIATIVAVELNKRVLIWHFRLVDFIDLVVLAPFYLIALYNLHRTIKPKGIYNHLSIAGIATFLYGHAMHVTGNAINTFITEVHHYRNLIPDDSYELIYFLDENLSHYIIFIALFALLIIWCVAETRMESTRLLWPATALGVVEGIVQTIAMIEGSKPFLPFIIGTMMIVCLLWVGKKRGGINTPICRYALATAIGLLFAPLIYLVVVGSLTEPSELTRVLIRNSVEIQAAVGYLVTVLLAGC
jgi:hypothetical protein